MSNDNETSLTPYMLVVGPILLLGAFFAWPAADYIGSRGTQSLVDEADSLMPLLIIASLGVMVMFGGLYLLNSEMIENSSGMNKQLLTVGSMLIIGSMIAFVMGMGSNVSVINYADADLDSSAGAVVNAFVDDADQQDTLNNAFDAGGVAWQMSPVTWGISLIIIGFVAFTTKRPESAMDFVLPALMPLGTLLLAAPILNIPDFFNVIFPLTIITHVIIGGLMISGKVELPESS